MVSLVEYQRNVSWLLNTSIKHDRSHHSLLQLLPCLLLERAFSHFNYLEISWAIRRQHDVQALLRTSESTARSPHQINFMEGPPCSSAHPASGGIAWRIGTGRRRDNNGRFLSCCCTDHGIEEHATDEEAPREKQALCDEDAGPAVCSPWSSN